jgi:hypothetical protein
MARPKRSDDLVDRERLLDILKCCRHDLAIAMARMRINGLRSTTRRLNC